MRILCVFSRHNYGDPSRGDSYEYANFVPAFRALGHEVEHFDSASRDLYANFADLNRTLLATAEDYRPDVIFAVQTMYEVWLETWELLRDAGATLIHWATDDSWKYEQQMRLIAPAFDICCTTSSDAYDKYLRDGHTHVLETQWAAAGANLQRPREGSSCVYDVSFVGTAHGNRDRWIQALKTAGVEVSCFGHGWPSGPITSRQVLAIFNESMISLNFANSALKWSGWRPMRSVQIKARNFEIPGAGGFLLTQRTPGLGRFFVSNREVVTFESPEELVTNVRKYIRSPISRDRVANAGYERVRSDHTYERRLTDILRFGAPLLERRGWTGVRWDRFESAEQTHGTSVLLRSLRDLLVFTCSVIWGRERGRRAARRAVYEMSWRLQGRQTYTARSLPGRLFFTES